MKKIVAVSVCLFIILSGFTDKVTAQEAPAENELYARAAVLMDGDSGRVLYEKNGKEALANASTTKILTCIIALENCDANQIVEFSETASKAPKVHLGAKCGSRFWMKDLLYAMMLESYNDCAVAIAEQIAGTVENFSSIMNSYAEKIGCKDTHFLTPNGLDAQNENEFHHTTAEDLALIMRFCIKESKKAEAFLKITGEKEYHFTDVDEKQKYNCYNHNAFLQMMDGAISGKTGFTGNAGYCYVGALEKDGRTYIVALLACGWPNNRSYKWSDTKKLMQYGMDNYRRTELDDIALEEEKSEAVPVENAQGDRIGESVKARLLCVKIYDTKSVLLKEGEQIKVEYHVAKRLTAPVKKGTIAGEISLKAGNIEVRKYRLITEKAIPEIDFIWCIRKVAGQML